MDIKELQDYRLSDAIKFHSNLNPKIWGRDEHLLPEVREKLLAIAADFKEFLGLDLEVKDITISGSNAAYTYTDHSDIDLHLVADLPRADASEVYRELFDAKKYQYNDQHNYKIGGYDVELYVQNANEDPKSQGIYSVLNNEWISVPKRRKPEVDDISVKSKYEDLGKRIEAAVKSGDSAQLEMLGKKVREFRQAGLDKTGEFGPENLAFKILRSNGTLDQLRAARLAAKDRELSIDEAKKKKTKKRYGSFSGMFFPGYHYYGQTDAADDGGGDGGESVKESHDDIDTQLKNFVKFCAQKLKLDKIPRIQIKRDPEWSRRNNSFGRYIPDADTLILSIANRHPLDIMRTMAHELTHRKQDEQADMPIGAGDTGSKYENQANAQAGVLMRDFAALHPEYFAKEPISEASGYIPVNKKEARDPRYSMALTVDIKPGENQRQAAKMGWKTDPAGTPPTAKTNGLVEALTRKLQLVKEGLGFPLVSEQEQELDEVAMSPSALRAFAASPAAQGMMAGFEAELIFSGIGDEGYSEPEWEPDYEQDERAYDIEGIIDFFQSGDFAELGPRAADRIRNQMYTDYQEWLDEKMRDDWDNDKDVAIREYLEVRENLDGEELKQRLETALEEENDDYDNAREVFEEDWQNTHENDESDWLRSIGIRYMTDANNTYDDLMWPHYTDVNQGSGGDGEFSEASAERLADDLSETLGVKTTVSSGYHSATRDTESWIFEPDGSLSGDEPGDMPVEIVSPPMPLAQALEIMPKFFAWAESNGAYANKSTGFHMSVSMPEHEGQQLDYTKLALFLGDEYVLQQFGRAANTYAKSAISKIRDNMSTQLKEDSRAETVLQRMRTHLDQFASRALAQPSGFGKYTSINPKNNYIEFRSAGGSDYFRDIDKIQNTLMRYARATNLAMDPGAEKPEYAKKLYKLLTKTETQQVTDPRTGTKRTEVVTPVDKDAISIFSRYVAGELPKSALKSFLKQIQYSREVSKNAKQGPRWEIYRISDGERQWPKDWPTFAATNKEQARDIMKDRIQAAFGDNWLDTVDRFDVRPSTEPKEKIQWRVTHPNGTSSIIFQASSAEEAIQLAKQEWGDRMNPDDAYRAEPYLLATQTPQTDQMTQPAADDPAGNFVLRRREGNEATGPVLYRFYAANNAAAVEAAREWTTARGIERRSVWLDHVSGVPPEVLSAHGGPQQSGTLSQTDVENRLGWGDQTADATHEVVDRTTLRPIFKFIANGAIDAAQRYHQILNAMGLPIDTEDYGWRPIPRTAQQPQVPEVPIDVAQNFREPPASWDSGPPAGNQFSGEWKVVDGLGREVHRFGGIGNSQADANRVARQWAQQTGFDGNLEVYPVMR